MKVFVVVTEWNRPSDGNSFVIEGVTVTKPAAEKLVEQARERELGYGNAEVCNEPVHWDFETTIQEHEVQ